jgi:23S rRNA (adenine2503-C2)-methyltransferase
VAQCKKALLAVSLHAPTQDLRLRLMPGAAGQLPLDRLLADLKNYPLQPRERITIEYLLLKKINDQPAHARELVRILNGIRCKINLIPCNPGPGLPYEAPEEQSIDAFLSLLWDKGMTATVRKSKGQDIAAACGQLVTQRK